MLSRCLYYRPVLLLWLLVAGLSSNQIAMAAPPGFSEQTIVASDAVLAPAALAYSPNGTLYVVEANQSFGLSSSQVDVINPNGTLGAPITVTPDGASSPAFGGFFSIGGAAWDPFTNSGAGSLLVTDAAPGNGALYSIDPITGIATTLYSGDSFIAQVAVRSNGDIFVSDATGSGQGSIDYVSLGATPALVPVVTGLDFGAGIGFDAAGHLIYQEAVLTSPSTTAGEVLQTMLFGSGAGTTAGPSTPLSTNTAGFNLAVAPNGDVYVTGSGGLFRIDHASNAISLFESVGPFATGLSLLASTGQLAYIPLYPDFSSPNVVVFTPIAVPEPSALILAVVAGLVAAAATRRSKRAAA